MEPIQEITHKDLNTFVVDLEQLTFVDNQVLQYAVGKFPALNEQFKSLNKSTFMPVEATDFQRLCYLTTLKNHLDKSPFTEEAVRVFKDTEDKIGTTNRWFKLAYIPFIFLGAASFINFVSIAHRLSAIRKLWITSSVNAASSFGSNVASLIITGTNPDTSQSAADAKQTIYEDAKEEKYKEIAYELIDQYAQDPEFGRLLAAGIDFEKLYEQAEKSAVTAAEARAIFKKLSHVCDFILKGTELPEHEMRKYLRDSLRDNHINRGL